MQILDWLWGASMFIPPWEAFLRMLASVLAGAAVGFDRELRNKPAGLRTHILISLAAALFTLITFELHHTVVRDNPHTTADPIRIIEAVTAGVAFLAAGAIIQSRGNVHGLTTGANMWLAGALGVACGAGDYTLAVLGTVFAVIVLVLLGRLESAARKKASQEKPSGEDGGRS
ncbi:MAG TPA: MgtC/SapB family protein [Steroidobacteraceae bacterium]|nr:MgtC/SapB family protein [Steroidobacteraceae bacterium]